MFDFAIDVSPSLVMVLIELEELGKHFRSFKEPLKDAIQQVIAPAFKANFASEGEGSWAPLIENTLMHPGAGTILDRTGTLRRAAGYLKSWTIDGPGGTATMDQLGVEYGVFHQESTRNMPSRPWAVISSEDEAQIDDGARFGRLPRR